MRVWPRPSTGTVSTNLDANRYASQEDPERDPFRSSTAKPLCGGPVELI